MSEIIQKIQELGLEKYEARVLRVLLDERVSFRDLSRKSGVPFGKIYSVIKSLGKSIKVEETNERPRVVYLKDPGNCLTELIRRKQEKDKMLFESLRNLTSVNMKIKERFLQVALSTEERLAVQTRMFKDTRKEVLQFFNRDHDPMINRRSKWVYEKVIKEAVQGGGGCFQDDLSPIY